MKKHFKCPIEKEFNPGVVTNIFTDYKNQKGFQGRGRLLKILPSNQRKSERIYIRAQIGDGKKQAPHTIIWGWQKWRIRFIDGPNKGWVTSRKIAYFVAISNYYKMKN